MTKQDDQYARPSLKLALLPLTSSAITLAGGYFGSLNETIHGIAGGTALEESTQMYKQLSEMADKSPEKTENLRRFADQIHEIARKADVRRENAVSWQATLGQKTEAEKSAEPSR